MQWKFPRSWLMCTLVVIDLTMSVMSAGVPPLDLPGLINSSDLIVLGKTQGVRQIGESTIEIYGQQFPAKIMGGEVSIERTIKGQAPKGVAFHFLLPATLAGSIGYRSIPDGNYRLVFLKHAGSDYDVASPYYPSFPAVPDEPLAQERTTIVSQVIAELAAVLQSPDSPNRDKVEALFYAQGLNTPVLTAALRTALSTDDKSLQLGVATALLERNDISALQVAEEALLHPQSNIPSYLLENLSSGIARGLRDDRAIPALGRILQEAPDAYARRAAASALRDTGSTSATLALGKALADSDFDVRYLAVIGLAEITGQSEWRPLTEEFRTHEQRYLNHWTRWTSAQLPVPPNAGGPP